MELDENQKKVLELARALTHDDALDCKNAASLMEIYFYRKDEKETDPNLIILGGFIASTLRARAELSKMAIDSIREYYHLFVDKEG